MLQAQCLPFLTTASRYHVCSRCYGESVRDQSAAARTTGLRAVTSHTTHLSVRLLPHLTVSVASAGCLHTGSAAGSRAALRRERLCDQMVVCGVELGCSAHVKVIQEEAVDERGNGALLGRRNRGVNVPTLNGPSLKSAL